MKFLLAMLALASLPVLAAAPSLSQLDEMIANNSVVLVIDASKQGTRNSSQTLKLYENGKRTIHTKVTTGPHTQSMYECESSTGRAIVSSIFSMALDGGRSCEYRGQGPYKTGSFRVRTLRGDFRSPTLLADLENTIILSNAISIYHAPNSRRTLGVQGSKTGLIGLNKDASEIVFDVIKRAGRDNVIVHIHI